MHARTVVDTRSTKLRLFMHSGKQALRWVRVGIPADGLVQLPWCQCHIVKTVWRMFYADLITSTKNFSQVRWNGSLYWLNPLHAFTIQKVICELRPTLIIECGTYFGGSARFYADIMD